MVDRFHSNDPLTGKIKVGDFVIRVVPYGEGIPCGWTMITEQAYGQICYKTVDIRDILDIELL